MEIDWDQAEIQCPACREILVLRVSVVEIWCPWCEEPYEVREIPHRTDPSRTLLTLARRMRSGR